MTVTRRSISSSKRGVASDLGSEPVERVVAEDLPSRSLPDRGPPPGPEEQDELGVGDGPEQPFDERRAQEAGGAGDGDPLAGQSFPDHAHLSTIW